MNIKNIIAFLLTVVMIFTIATPAFAISNSDSRPNKTIYDDSVIQTDIEDDEEDYYKITATKTQYYQFTILNQSSEIRGYGVVGDVHNFFLGGLYVEITDYYDMMLASGTVNCGYTASVSLKLTKGESYYIKISGKIPGNYRLSVKTYTDVGSDTWQSATEIQSVGQVISNIDVSGDEDWFYFTTDSSDSFYKIFFENISGTSTMSLELLEYVPGGGDRPYRDVKTLYANHSYTDESQIKLKPNSKYFVKMSQSPGTGAYQLSIEQRVDAMADKKTNAFNMEMDKGIITAIDGWDDVDWFKFKTKSYDAYYFFEIENYNIGQSCHFVLYDAYDKTVLDGYSGTSYSMNESVKLEPDTEYYFKIYSFYNATGNYSVKIKNVADDYPDTLENAKAVSLNKKISGKTEGKNDDDWFKFTTTANDAYYDITFTNSTKSGTYLRIYDTSGLEVESVYAYSNETRTGNFKFNSDTDYYVRVVSSGLGSYSFKIVENADDYGNTMKGAYSIKADKQITGEIEGSGDVDWFKFKTNKNGAYYKISADNQISSSLEVYLFDKEETDITGMYIYPRESGSRYVKLEANTYYYLKVNSGYTGSYKIKVQTIADADADEKEDATNITMNTSVTRDIAINDDVDWFKVTVSKDCNLRLYAKSEDGSYKEFELYSIINNRLIYLDVYSSTSWTSFVDSGEYYVKVKGSTGYYTFTVADCGSGHKNTYRYSPATASEDGIKTTYCKSCKEVIKKEDISKISKITLSGTQFTYNGKNYRPTVKVVNSNGKTISSRNYTVTYPSNTSALGTYTVKIKFKNAYSGTAERKFTVVLGVASKIEVDSTAKTAIKLDWSSVSGATGYRVYKQVGGTWNKVADVKTSEYTVKNLKAGTDYRFAVRAYSKLSNGTTVWATKYKKIDTATCTETPTISKVISGTRSATVYWNNVSGEDGYQIYYSTKKDSGYKKYANYKANSKSGTVKKLTKGKTYYFRVRAYTKTDSGYVYSSFSSAKSVKIK